MFFFVCEKDSLSFEMIYKFQKYQILLNFVYIQLVAFDAIPSQSQYTYMYFLLDKIARVFFLRWEFWIYK